MDLHNGKVITTVMITTTMLDVVGMVEIVVEVMSTNNTAPYANALIPMHNVLQKVRHMHF